MRSAALLTSAGAFSPSWDLGGELCPAPSIEEARTKKDPCCLAARLRGLGLSPPGPQLGLPGTGIRLCVEVWPVAHRDRPDGATPAEFTRWSRGLRRTLLSGGRPNHRPSQRGESGSAEREVEHGPRQRHAQTGEHKGDVSRDLEQVAAHGSVEVGGSDEAQRCHHQAEDERVDER